MSYLDVTSQTCNDYIQGHLITTTNISQSSSLNIQSYLCNIIFLSPGKQTNVSVKTFIET